MTTDTFQATTGAQAWDIAANWSLQTVPQATDDVVYTGPAPGYSTVTIVAADPAYVIASLTEATANQMAVTQSLSVAGQLTVTGATSISTGALMIFGNAKVSLNTLNLSNSAEIGTSGTGTPTLSIGSLTAGAGISSGSVLVSNGTTTIGAVSGPVSVNVYTGGTAIIGTSAGTSFFGLSGGRLDIQSPSSSLADTIDIGLTVTNLVDLQSIAYQPGETATTALVKAGLPNTDSVTLRSLGGQTLYTFQSAEWLDISYPQATPQFSLASDGASGTLVTIACYCRGTRILTAHGEIPVEDLAIGDLVVTFGGTGNALKPVRWLGHRRIDLRRHPDRENTHPVRFRAGSLGESYPHRDLLVSPGHRMRVDDALVTALELVNGATIVQESPDEAEYWHIELDGHDLVLAEGAQAETYQDTGNRSAFENGNIVTLHPVLDGTVTDPCLPYAGASSAVRARLIARAEAMGWTRSVDPAPWIEADGQQIVPSRVGERCRFTLPVGTRSVRLRSRATRPWDVDGTSGDRRRLGLKLHHLAVGGADRVWAVALTTPALGQGFNQLELDAEARPCRWTTGDTPMDLTHLAPGQAVTVLEIGYDQALPMWIAPAATDLGRTTDIIPLG